MTELNKCIGYVIIALIFICLVTLISHTHFVAGGVNAVANTNRIDGSKGALDVAINRESNIFECTTTVRGIIGGDGFNPQDEGLIRIELHPEWAPIGAARVKDLVADHFFDDIPLFRGLANFLIQFGINTKNATKNKYWKAPHTIADDYNPNIPDANKEKQTGSNIPPFTDGIVSFAGSGKDSRSTHLFMTLGTQRRLGKAPWEVPVGRVVGKGSLKVLHTIYTGYGNAPKQPLLDPRRGPTKVAEYLKDNFPKLDWINKCSFKM